MNLWADFYFLKHHKNKKYEKNFFTFYFEFNGVIYFDVAVNNIQLYDLSGKLLYANKYGTQLIVGKNNPKGTYVLKYNDVAVKILF